ncbi:hypothetical protein B0T26DRAFT_675589 [Lasiosphaeria miniovina]|uniref:Uncharacterized protein n=1 Tax=Lasiosphaeria miniovina TaxID=1954250 RepID=A0AA40AJZ4_9PEZI|nr:uncharacterized protein B0T26DRAFT_675589 [Lasiosphaeria miniovina]KAK0717257.1 hypothetical protein B0T26DRAFT_675589 [Lasiosphaeria miniovina]
MFKNGTQKPEPARLYPPPSNTSFYDAVNDAGIAYAAAQFAGTNMNRAHGMSRSRPRAPPGHDTNAGAYPTGGYANGAYVNDPRIYSQTPRPPQPQHGQEHPGHPPPPQGPVPVPMQYPTQTARPQPRRKPQSEARPDFVQPTRRPSVSIPDMPPNFTAYPMRPVDNLYQAPILPPAAPPIIPYRYLKFQTPFERVADEHQRNEDYREYEHRRKSGWRKTYMPTFTDGRR